MHISPAVGVDLMTALELSLALIAEDREAETAVSAGSTEPVSDGSAPSRNGAANPAETQPNPAGSTQPKAPAAPRGSQPNKSADPAETSRPKVRASQPNTKRVTVQLDGDKPAGRNLRTVQQLLEQARELDPMPTSADALAAALSVGLPKARQVRELLKNDPAPATQP
jgi:hypothetical protein